MEKMETATNVPLIQNDAEMESAEEREIDSILVLHVKDAEKPIALGLTKFQTFIVVKSILKQDEEGNIVMLDSEELIRCRDWERPLNHNLLSIHRAVTMLHEQKVCGAVLYFHLEQEDPDPVRLENELQTAVILSRLGINPATGEAVSDEKLEVIYGTEWDPEFVTGSLVQTPAPAPSYSRRNLMAGVRKPKHIKKSLDKTIVGQDDAKETLATAVYRQELATRYNDLHKNDKNFVPMKQQRVLLYGATGSGKTALIRKLGEAAGCPVVSYDVTTLVPPGVEGNGASETIYELLRKCGGDTEKASHGIVCLDKMDQLLCGDAADCMRPVQKAALLNELLQLMEGRNVGFRDEEGSHKLNTSGILFVISGEFPELDGIVLKRAAGKDCNVCCQGDRPAIGFLRNTTVSKENSAAMRDMPEAALADLKEWGVPVEMLEHVTSVCRTKAPDRNDLVNILAHSDASPVQQYQKMLRMHNVTLQIPDQVLETVADKALEQEMGAHALASILEKALTPVMFRLAGNRKRMTLRLQPECFTAGKAPKLLPIKAS